MRPRRGPQPPAAAAGTPPLRSTQALDRYERKRNLAMARRVRVRLGELQPA